MDAEDDVLTLNIERTSDAVVVHCHGRLVAGETELLYDEVSRLIPDNQRIVLDLSQLAHMDSSGLGTLVRIWVSAKSAHCDLELQNLGKRIRQLLGLTNMLQVFTVVGENRTNAF